MYWILNKLSNMFLTLFGVITIIFFLFNVLPGDPAQMMLDQNENSEQLYKNCTCIKIPQILTLNTHFSPRGYPGGPRGAKILKWPCRGVIWKIGYGFFGTFVLILVT